MEVSRQTDRAGRMVHEEEGAGKGRFEREEENADLGRFEREEGNAGLGRFEREETERLERGKRDTDSERIVQTEHLREENEQFRKLFQQLVREEEQLHEENQRRIKAGIQCLFWVPALFLILLLLTDSEKAIFLVLWIVSLFVIASYLIYIEYLDFQSKERLQRFSDQAEKTNFGLIGSDLEAFEEMVSRMLLQIKEKKAENRQKLMDLLAPQKESSGIGRTEKEK